MSKIKKIIISVISIAVIFCIAVIPASAATYVGVTFYYGYPGQYGGVVIEQDNSGTVDFTGLYGQVQIDHSVSQIFSQDWFICDASFDNLPKQSGYLRLKYGFYFKGDISGFGTLKMNASDGMTIAGQGSVWNGNYEYTTTRSYGSNYVLYNVVVTISFDKISVNPITNIRCEFNIPALNSVDTVQTVWTLAGYEILTSEEIKTEQETGSTTRPVFTPYDFAKANADFEIDESGEYAEDALDDVTDAMPSETDGFDKALGKLATAMSTNSTNAVWEFPAIYIPAISGVTPRINLSPAQEINFSQYIEDLIPENILQLVQYLGTVALILYCAKELWYWIQYAMSLRKGGGE